MKTKKLIVLIAVLLALAALALVKTAKQRAAEKAEAPISYVSLNKEVSPAFIQEVEITSAAKPDDKVVVKKNEKGDWTLTSWFGAVAPKAKMDSFLKAMTEIKGEARANSAEVLEDFGLTETKAVRVVMKSSDGKTAAHTFVSPKRAAGSQTFVRDASSHEVIIADTDLLGEMGIWSDDAGPDKRIFADLHVARFDFNNVTKIEVAAMDKNPAYTLVKTEDKDKAGWKFEPDAGKELDPVKVNELITGISNMYAREPLDPDQDHKISASPWIRLTVKDKKDPIELYLGHHDAEKKTRVVKSMPDNLIYLVDEYAADNLLKKNQAAFLKA